ncbi:MAG: hypothetical protein J6J42_09360 [Lachnospiraceae bacterium]|nr:hypothetical protein [Lachnospiraceae bacterium]
MKRITLSQLEKTHKINDYMELYSVVTALIQEEKIKPVKTTGLNGKKPALFKEYWVIEGKEDFSAYVEELSYLFVSMISTDYYLGHRKQYVEDREWVLRLNQFLKTNRESLSTAKSLNERSFEIWHREKFLKEEQGKKILKRCGISMEQLNVYETTEPLSYYVHTRTTPQNMLILENKDTFYSMRKHLLTGQNRIIDTEIGTVIYGAGKGIYRSFQDFSLCAEPYMKEKENILYYLGDIDYEGILIYETLAEQFAGEYKVQPFVQGYAAMLQKAEKMGFEKLPRMKERQNQKIGELFYSFFDREIQEKIQRLLESGCYIPQEILSVEDL